MTQAIAHHDKIVRSGMLIVNGDGDSTYLYRIYDALDNLVYIGISNDLAMRLAGHRSTARWWIAAYRVEFDVYPTRAMAMRAEAQSISRLRPSHNISLNNR